MNEAEALAEFDPALLAPPVVAPRNNYIRSLDTLVALTQRFADELNLDIVQESDSEKLRLGYYPDKASFEPFVTHGFYNRLPNTHGLVFPYVREKIVTMLVVNEMESETALSSAGRTYIYGDGQHHFNKQGIFGGHRLKGKSRREIVLTDNELLVCRTPNAIAVQELCDFSLELLHARAKHIVLTSNNRSWIIHMMKLSKLGFDISVDSEHVLEYVAREIINLTKASLTPAKLARQAARYLRGLTVLEQGAVVKTVERFTGVTIQTAVYDTVRPEYISETAYFADLTTTLFTKIEAVAIGKDTLILTLKAGGHQKLLIQPSAVVAFICTLFDVKEDLVQWSYNHFNGIPRSVKDAGTSRWAHNLAIAELVLTVLTRHATLSPE